MTRWSHGWNVLAVGMLFQAATFGTIFYCFTLWVAPWMQTLGGTRSAVALLESSRPNARGEDVAATHE